MLHPYDTSLYIVFQWLHSCAVIVSLSSSFLVKLSRFVHPYAIGMRKKYAHYLYCIGFRLTDDFFFHF